MPLYNPTWIYLGNDSHQVNANWQTGATAADRATTLAEAEHWNGQSWSANGMQGVVVTGNPPTGTSFVRGGTQLSYALDDAAGNPGPTVEQVYTSHVVVELTIDTIRPLASGGYETSSVNLRGVIVQMQNGDTFIRPHYQSQATWDQTLSGWSISEITVNGISTGLSPADSNTDRYSSNLAGSTGYNPSFIHDGSFVPCFARGTLIDTPLGPTPVERIRKGDLVLTRDHGPQSVLWHRQQRLSRRQLREAPNLLPIRIRAGALGPGLPARDLVVSPQHRLLVRSSHAEALFGTAEVLIAAKHLLAVPGVEIDPPAGEVVYHHLLLQRHEILLAEGAEAESLLPGPQVMRSVGFGDYHLLRNLFPGLARMENIASARRLCNGREARAMLRAHMKADPGAPLTWHSALIAA